MNLRLFVVFIAIINATVACQPAGDDATVVPQTTAAKTASDAAEFVHAAEKRLEKLVQHSERQEWVQSNFITLDTEILAAKAKEAQTFAEVDIANQAAEYISIPDLDADTERKLGKLRSGITIPAPKDPQKNAEQAEIGAKLKSLYGKGQYCRSENDCLALSDLENTFKYSRNPAELLEAWNGWRQVSPAMKPLYTRQVELANEGAQALGYDNLGTMWRSGYDMDPAEFPQELDRLWGQVRPLYEALHCHVRARLGEAYGSDVVPQNSPIPAHLLGNMWAQEWTDIYDLVGPEETSNSYDLNEILVRENFDATRMVKTGEAFFSSLGFEELPQSFWERSLFVKPADREVICHASAWNIDEKEDLRIKMCIKVNEEDFTTIHHELGHNYYQRAYNQESYLYRQSANDGFHEAVGDTLGLSITPKYLNQIGLLDEVPDETGDVGLLLKQALSKVAFVPFSLMVDQWRWRVFAGEVGPESYNELWWQLREQYQGVMAPNARPADAFDPGAKYHVPGNTPYSRYFLARILQFQFFRSLCEIAGDKGPIHRCSIFGSKAAGERLNAMLEMGRREPWPVALEALTGSKQMDATAMLDYFEPLKNWLDEQNEGRQCGW